jgi:hypothetical protein
MEFMKRLFTLDEATELLPVLKSLLQSAIDSSRQLQQAQRRLQEINHHVFLSGGSLLKISDMLALKNDSDHAAQRLREALEEIDSMGVQVKDLEIGLLDFPCRVDDGIILLCWKLGEPAIGFWHKVEDGFKGRRPIDDRIPRTGSRPS